MYPPSMQAFLVAPDFVEAIVAGAEKNKETAKSLTTDLTEAQLNWRPSADMWSIAQCLEHLAVATKEFEKYFGPALASAPAKPLVTKATAYKPTLLGGWLAKQVSPEGERKLKSPKIFRPAPASNIAGAVAMFLDRQRQFVDFVRRCASIDYNKSRIRSPVTPLIRYSLADAFVITVLHGERHLNQARRVREMPQFPKA